MQRKYHTYTSPAFPAPSAGVPMHSIRRQAGAVYNDGGEIIVPKNIDEKSKTKPALVENGRILGRFETDDIMLLCIIFLLLQNGDDMDMALLLALGYIFLSDKDLGIF